MTIVIPKGPRSRLRQTPGGLELLIPVRRNALVLLLVPAWLVGWFLGERAGIGELLSRGSGSDSLLPLVWIVPWTVGGIYVALSWVWALVGRERVLITPDLLELKEELLGMSLRRQYRLGEVRRLRLVGRGATHSNSLGLWGRAHGQFAFDYGSQTFRFAAGIDEAEAEDLLEALTRSLTRQPVSC